MKRTNFQPGFPLYAAVALLYLYAGCTQFHQSAVPAPKTPAQIILSINSAIEATARETAMLVSDHIITGAQGHEMVVALEEVARLNDHARILLLVSATAADVDAAVALATWMMIQTENRLMKMKQGAGNGQ